MCASLIWRWRIGRVGLRGWARRRPIKCTDDTQSGILDTPKVPENDMKNKYKRFVCNVACDPCLSLRWFVFCFLNFMYAVAQREIGVAGFGFDLMTHTRTCSQNMWPFEINTKTFDRIDVEFALEQYRYVACDLGLMKRVWP